MSKKPFMLPVTTLVAALPLLLFASLAKATTPLGNNMYDWPTDAYYNMAYPIQNDHTQSVRMKTILHYHCKIGPNLCDCLTANLNRQGLYSHGATMLAFTMQHSGCIMPEFYSQ